MSLDGPAGFGFSEWSLLFYVLQLTVWVQHIITVITLHNRTGYDHRHAKWYKVGINGGSLMKTNKGSEKAYSEKACSEKP